jgi:hypothetical protein
MHTQVCPTGFVIPEEPLRPGVDWAPGSGCAAACPRPVFTAEEYDDVSKHKLTDSLLQLRNSIVCIRGSSCQCQ